VSFVRDIAPILESRCLVCHHQANAPKSGGLNLESRQLALSTGRNSPVIIPGDPDHSPLVTSITADQDRHASMPPIAHSLSHAQLKLIKTWIKEGAEWPANSKGDLSRPGS
jgi:mono/diheme cytochrome c family protein